MKTPRNSRDIAREVTDAIVSRLEAGTTPWTRSWSLTGEGGRPLRHEGTPYNGINCLWLWTIADARGYRSRYWMTARQAEELGARVRRKADPSMSIYASSFRKAGQPGLMGEANGLRIEQYGDKIELAGKEYRGYPREVWMAVAYREAIARDMASRLPVVEEAAITAHLTTH